MKYKVFELNITYEAGPNSKYELELLLNSDWSVQHITSVNNTVVIYILEK